MRAQNRAADQRLPNTGKTRPVDKPPAESQPSTTDAAANAAGGTTTEAISKHSGPDSQVADDPANQQAPVKDSLGEKVTTPPTSATAVEKQPEPAESTAAVADTPGVAVRSTDLEEKGVTGVDSPSDSAKAPKVTAENHAADNLRGHSIDRANSLEGERNYDVYRPEEPRDKITDIDKVEDGVLWEEKTATTGENRLTGTDETDKWVAKHVTKKCGAYVEARQQLPGYEDAPIGFDFMKPNAEPAFRDAVEKECDRLRTEYPGVTIITRWR